MLERTAGCLETKCLRSFLPGPKKTFKSKRALHSCFWSHGTHDLELSPLWTALLRGTESVNNVKGQLQRTATASPAKIFLDFLYPAGTLNLLQFYSGWNAGQDTRQIRLLRRLGHRFYTSSSRDLEADHKKPKKDTDHKSNEPNKSVDQLSKLQHLINFADYEGLWTQYARLGEDEQKEVRRQILLLLSVSNRIVDAERVTQLFETLLPEQIDASAYEAVIKALLRLNDFSRAIEVHSTALNSCESPVGSDELLASLVSKGLWLESHRVWSDFRNYKRRLPHLNFGIFKALKLRDNLYDDIVELIGVVDEERITDDGFKEFAAAIIRIAILSEQHYTERPFKRFVQVIQRWGFDDSTFYSNCIRLLLKKGNERLIVRTYRVARLREGISFDQNTLHELLKIFCENDSIVGIQEVLDDFFRFHNKLTRTAYNMTINFFARDGDVGTVHAMFEQYRNRFHAYHKNHTAASGDLAPLLVVHSRRGELGEVIKYFNQIQDVYNAYPTITCWNILLSAYGRVHDVDGAFGVFQAIRDSQKVQADDWTYATLMAICVLQGDRQSVIDIWEDAREKNIQASTAMVDCLVQAYIQDDMLTQAENICEEAISQSLKGSRTYMWNLLISARAARLDVANAHKIFQQMTKRGVKHNELTYAALMQAVVMATQCGHAEAILKDVMPKAGVKITSFHYAILMGGYIREGHYDKVLLLHDEMMRKGFGRSASTRLLALKASVNLTSKASSEAKVQLQQAVGLFESIIQSLNPQDIAPTPRKGGGRQPLHVMYPTMFYTYFMSVLARYGDSKGVDEVFGRFQALIPQNEKNNSPLSILTILMRDKIQQDDHEGISKLWQLLLQRAIAVGKPIVSSGSEDDFSNSKHKILPFHRFDLCSALTYYMKSLDATKNLDLLEFTITHLLALGFALDSKNWNHYIQILARNHRLKPAFDLCESRLMDGFTGWAKLRAQMPGVPVRLPAALRRQGHWKVGHLRVLRPLSKTMLYLVKAYLNLQEMAVESKGSATLLLYLNQQCPRAVEAVKTMQRTHDSIEIAILGSQR